MELDLHLVLLNDLDVILILQNYRSDSRGDALIRKHEAFEACALGNVRPRAATAVSTNAVLEKQR